MLDFIRLNLNGVIGTLITLFVITLVRFVGMRMLGKTPDEDLQKVRTIINGVYTGIIVVILVISFISMTYQFTTNVIPKNTVDRSYIDKALKNKLNEQEKK